MATKYLYEHIIYKYSEAIFSSSALLAVLQDSAKGEQLARMVIRVDINISAVHPHLQSTLLRLCPNLQSIYINDYAFDYPRRYSNGSRNLPTLSVDSELLQDSEYQRFWSTADHWHSLTILFEPSREPVSPKNILPPPPDSGGKEFNNLRHINIVSRSVNKYSIRNLKHWPLPSVTHFTINSYIPGTEGAYDDALDMLRSSRLGLQLKFFALLVPQTTSSHQTTAFGSLELLKAMPNLEEVALPFFWDSAQLPDTAIIFPKVHTMGMEIHRFDYTAAATPANAFATYTETCCRLFPNIQTIRTTSIMYTCTGDFFLANKVGPMVHLKKASALLKRRGIKFEDCTGRDINKVLC